MFISLFLTHSLTQMYESMSSAMSENREELQMRKEEVAGLRSNLEQALRENNSLKQVRL